MNRNSFDLDTWSDFWYLTQWGWVGKFEGHSLDVGCGDCKRGDVGVDLQWSPVVDVICDAQRLPFRDGSFEVVFSNHVLEHMIDPVLALKEWCRVAKNHVHLYLPWRNGLMFTKNKGKGSNPLMRHRWSFNKTWFYKFGEKYGLDAQPRYSDFFILPIELEVYIFKKGMGLIE